MIWLRKICANCLFLFCFSNKYQPPSVSCFTEKNDIFGCTKVSTNHLLIKYFKLSLIQGFTISSFKFTLNVKTTEYQVYTPYTCVTLHWRPIHCTRKIYWLSEFEKMALLTANVEFLCKSILWKMKTEAYVALVLCTCWSCAVLSVSLWMGHVDVITQRNPFFTFSFMWSFFSLVGEEVALLYNITKVWYALLELSAV